MLAVEDAVIAYDGNAVVQHVDLTVAAGETVAVLGPSGCGKTTLLRAIAGLQPLGSGRVTWDGTDLAGTPPHERRFGLVFQEYALFPHRDVRGNVEFGLRMAHTLADQRAQRVDEVLDLVGLRDLKDRRVAQLSGGEQQRVALARALAVSPRLLMLDEPLGALDRSLREHLLEEIRALLDREQLAALYVTHDQDEAFAIAHRVVVMRLGRVVQQGTPVEVWRAPADPWTATFLGFGPQLAVAARDGRVELPWGSAPTDIAGHAIVVLRPDAVHIGGTTSARVVGVRFGAVDVDVTLQPERGPALRARVAHRDAPQVGADISFTVDPEGVLIFPDPPD